MCNCDLSQSTCELSLLDHGLSTHPGLHHEGGGDPGLGGDPGAVGHIVLEQLGDKRAEVHVRREDHDDLGRGLNYSLNDALDVLWGTHLKIIKGMNSNTLHYVTLCEGSTVYLGQGLREGDADTGFLHLLLEVFDAILAVIIIGSYGAHPSPAEV